MTTLAIDIETYSSVDLTKCGVYPYTEAPDFTVLLLAYAYDDDPVQLVDLAQDEDLPNKVYYALTSPKIIKTAFNANFERACLAEYYGVEMDPRQWRCTQVQALSAGLPLSLAEVGKALKLPQDKQKLTIGRSLIRYFCLPQKRRGGTLFGASSPRNLPQDSPEKWELFRAYCIQDVETERYIRSCLPPISDAEQELWCLDQAINNRGVGVDLPLVRQAITCAAAHQACLEAEAMELTGLDNPKSVSQLKRWLKDTEGFDVESLNKESVPVLLAGTENDTVKRVLSIRQELAKTSIKKYEAMERSRCDDNRIRGLFQFCGANRSGRWAGRLVQVQNLPQNHLADLDLARQLVREGRGDDLELLYGNLPATLSELLRTALVPAPGHKFVVADFSAIEARIIAWLAGEDWRLEVFATHGKIYEASASAMFKVPIEEITKGSPLRQKGKIAELALGYGGAVGALTAMGALKMGLEEAELQPLVNLWRGANRKIVQLWWDVEEAAFAAVQGDKRELHGLCFRREAGRLYITLPSGRPLVYVRPRIEPEPKYSRDGITYEGYEQGRWGRLHTRGAKLVENIVQAIARDCLAEGMLRLAGDGYKIVMHVHDEVVLEVPEERDCLDAVCARLGEDLPWAQGLLLRADGYECDYYRKD